METENEKQERKSKKPKLDWKINNTDRTLGRLTKKSTQITKTKNKGGEIPIDFSEIKKDIKEY